MISYRHYAAAYKNSIVVERANTGLISRSAPFFSSRYIEMFSLREIMLIYTARVNSRLRGDCEIVGKKKKIFWKTFSIVRRRVYLIRASYTARDTSGSRECVSPRAVIKFLITFPRNPSLMRDGARRRNEIHIFAIIGAFVRLICRSLSTRNFPQFFLYL